MTKVLNFFGVILLLVLITFVVTSVVRVATSPKSKHKAKVETEATSTLDFKIKQSNVFTNGEQVITTKIFEGDKKTGFLTVSKYELIYTNEIKTTGDSLTILKESEMNKANEYTEIIRISK